MRRMTRSFSTPLSFKELIAKKLIFGGVENDPEKATPFKSSNDQLILSSLLSLGNDELIKKLFKNELMYYLQVIDS